jgi:tRNA (guanine26-N2/guanine27-N2)-dimethyltransferase
MFIQAMPGVEAVKWSQVVEGRTRLTVPYESLGVREPPTTPVFFNPAASVNRDVSVAVTEATDGRSFCDSLCGVGARGVRIAREVRRRVTVELVDFNQLALRAARRNALLNGVEERCRITRSEANSFLYSRFRRGEKFDYVDVDPFGTPVPYFMGAVSATSDGGLVSFTATDTAVLCGVHRAVARRRYMAEPMNNHFCHETALRILFNSCRRFAASLDIGVEPVAAHSTRHYLRIFCRVRVGPSLADRLSSGEGHVAWCPACGRTSVSGGVESRCAECGSAQRSAGPLWVGEMADLNVVRRAADFARRRGMKAALTILERLASSAGLPPFGYSVEEACSRAGVSSVSETSVVGRLREVGFRAERQPFEERGIKTDAPYGEVLRAVKQLSAGR